MNDKPTLNRGDARAVEEMLKQTLIWHAGDAERMRGFSAATLRAWVERGGSAVVYDPDGSIQFLACGEGTSVELNLLAPWRTNTRRWNIIEAGGNNNLFYEVSSAICQREPPDDPSLSAGSNSRFRKTAAAGALSALIEVAHRDTATATLADLHAFVGKRSLPVMNEAEARWAGELVKEGGGWKLTGMSSAPFVFNRVLDDLQFYLAPFAGEQAQELYSEQKPPVDFRALRTPGAILYVTPPAVEARVLHGPVVSAILAHALFELVAEPEGAPVLFLVPYKAGVVVPEMWTYAAIGRGRKIAMWMGYDGPEQMREDAGERAEEFMSMFGAQLALPEDEEVLLIEGPRGGGKTALKDLAGSVAAAAGGSPLLVYEIGAHEKVAVHIYAHPDWDMNLIVEANASSRGTATDLLGDGDVTLLTCTDSVMSREEFEKLPEFDG